MKKATIIVPTYNDAAYIGECIDSIIAQSYRDIEIIVIIDGSTDATRDVLNAYKKESRLFVYEQENSGPGVARNNGLDRATGDYILFVDSDDWLPPDAVENMIKAAEENKSDLVICGYTYMYDVCGEKVEKHKVAIEPREIKAPYKSEIAELYYSGCIAGPVAKLYNAEIISANHLRFPKQRLLEDGFFNMLYINVASQIAACDFNVYFVRATPELKRYKNTQESKRGNPNFINAKKKLFDYICALDDLAKEVIFGSINILDEEERKWSNHFVRMIYISVNNIVRFGQSAALETLKSILNDSHARKALLNCRFDSVFYRVYSAALRRRMLRLVLALHCAGSALKRVFTLVKIARSRTLNKGSEKINQNAAR